MWEGAARFARAGLRGSSGLDAPVDLLCTGVSRRFFSSLAPALWPGASAALPRLIFIFIFFSFFSPIIVIHSGNQLSQSLSSSISSISLMLCDGHDQLQSLLPPEKTSRRATMTGSPRIADSRAVWAFAKAWVQTSYMHVLFVCDPFDDNSQLIVVQVPPAVLVREGAAQSSTDLPLFKSLPLTFIRCRRRRRSRERERERIAYKHPDSRKRRKPSLNVPSASTLATRPPWHIEPHVGRNGNRALAGSQQIIIEFIKSQTSRQGETDKHV